VDIVGENFDPVATQRVGHGGGVDVDSSFRAFLGAVELMDVQWQAPDRLTAIVPAGVSGGPFDLRVVGPTGEGSLPSAFAGSVARPAAIAATLSAPADFADAIHLNDRGAQELIPRLRRDGFFAIHGDGIVMFQHR